MSRVKIISTEPCGNLLAVWIEVLSDKVRFPNGDPEDENRVENATYRRSVRDVIYIEPPFSEEKVEEKINAVVSDVHKTHPPAVVSAP